MANQNTEREFSYGGKMFEIVEDSWVRFKTGDEYEIQLVFICHGWQVSATCFEKDRQAALATASAELYQLVLSHQSRCADCQQDIVSGLLSRRLPNQEGENS